MQLANIAVYPADSTDFSHQGYGILSDVLSAVVTEATADNNNVSQELEVTYPIGGTNVEYIKNTNMIRASTGTGADDYMIFEIYDYDENTDGTLSVHAQALPYRILKIPFDNGGIFDKFATVQLAINGGLSHVTGFPNWFHITSDVDVKQDFSKDQISNLGGMLDLILDRTECYVEYGWNYIKILKNRGKQITDVVLRDDSNVSGVQVVADYSNIINKIVPLLRARNAAGEYTDEPDYVGKIVTSKNPFKYIKYWSGMAAKFDGQEVADNYFVKEGVDQPKITATVNPLIIDDNLTAVKLFDSMQVYASKINYTATLKVVSRTFDALTCEVTDFKLGDKKKTLIDNNSTLSNIEDKINQANDTAQDAITSSNGKNTNYYSEDEPKNPVEGDTWFHTDDKGRPIIDQYIDGKWVQIVGHEKEDEVDKAIDQAQKDTEEAVKHANDAVAKADDANTKADQAVEQAGFAKNQSDSAKTDAQNANTAAQKAFKNAETAIKNINDLTIDGRNLLENSMLSRQESPTIFDNWNYVDVKQWAGHAKVVSDLSAPYQQYLQNTTVNPITTKTGTIYFTTKDAAYKQSRFPADTEISLSVMVRVHGANITTQAYFDGVAGSKKTLVDNRWTELHATGKPIYNSWDLRRITFGVYFSGAIPTGTVIDTTGWQVVRNAKIGTWTAAPEDPQASIENLNGQITLKANKADVDSVNNRVSSAESKITVNANNIALKASKTDVDTVDNRVSVAEGKITVNANAIAQTVSKTELTNKLSGYATQTWTQSQIKSTADSINLSVSSVSNKLDNMKVGTLNLLKHSNPNVRDNTHYPMPPGDISVVLEEGETYTLTSRAMTERNGTNTNILQIMVQHPSSWDWEFDLVMDNSTMETRSRTFKVPKMPDGNYNFTVSAFVYPHINGGNYGVVDWFTLTRGTVPATTWTPSYEELVSDVQYAQLEVKVNGIQGTVQNKADKSQVTQLANQITSTVTALGNKADKSQITQLSNQITSTVESIGASNWVYNSSFAYNDLSGWSQNAKTWYISNNPASTYNGTKSVGTNLTNFGNATGIAYEHLQSKPFPHTDVGVTFHYSVYVKIYGETSSNIRIFGDFATHDNAAGNGRVEFGDTNWVTTANGTDKWLKCSGYFTTSKAHTHVSFGLYYASVDKPGNVHVVFSRPMLSTADNAPYTDQGPTASQITQLSTDINLRVKTNDVINQINISKEGILIDGKRTHITGTTTIDNAVIKDAMIQSITANKLTAGYIDASIIKVYNIDVANLVGNKSSFIESSWNAISSYVKVNSNGINIGSGAGVLQLRSDGMHIIDNYKSEDVGLIHSNHVIYHPEINGLTFDLNVKGDYMAWGDESASGYDIKWAYSRTGSEFLGAGMNSYCDITVDPSKTIYTNKIARKYESNTAYLNLDRQKIGNNYDPSIGSAGTQLAFGGAGGIYLVNKVSNTYSAITDLLTNMSGLGTVHIPTSMSSDGKVSKWFTIKV